MSFRALLPQTFSHLRLTAELVADAVPFDRSVLRADGLAVLLKATGAGLNVDAQVAITGELDALPQTEVLIVPAPDGAAVSDKEWTAVNRVQATGAAAGTLTVEAIQGGGERAFREVALTTTLRGRLQKKSARLYTAQQGTVIVDRWTLFVADDVLREKDIIAAGSERWEVLSVYRVYAGSTFHHVEAEVQRLA